MSTNRVRASANVDVGQHLSDAFDDIMPGGVLMHFPTKPVDGQVCVVSNDAAKGIFPDSLVDQVGDVTSSDHPEGYLFFPSDFATARTSGRHKPRRYFPKVPKAQGYPCVLRTLRRWVSSLPPSDHYMANVILRCVRFKRQWFSSDQPFPNASIYFKPACGPEVENFLSGYAGVYPNTHGFAWNNHVLSIFSEVVRSYLARTSGVEYVSWDPLPPKLI